MTRPLAAQDRPRPLVDAATWVSRVTGLLGSLVTSLVGWGVVTAEQGDAVTGLLGAIPGAVALITSTLVAFHVVRRAEPLVTPLSDPRDNSGASLAPLTR